MLFLRPGKISGLLAVVHVPSGDVSFLSRHGNGCGGHDDTIFFLFLPSFFRRFQAIVRLVGKDDERIILLLAFFTNATPGCFRSATACIEEMACAT
jgi:hypothetical protein